MASTDVAFEPRTYMLVAEYVGLRGYQHHVNCPKGARHGLFVDTIISTGDRCKHLVCEKERFCEPIQNMRAKKCHEEGAYSAHTMLGLAFAHRISISGSLYREAQKCRMLSWDHRLVEEESTEARHQIFHCKK